MKEWGLLFLGPIGWVIKAWQMVPNKFKNIGADIINGLWNGIKAKATQLFDFVKSIGKGVANAFKSVLGIASPSKVFMDYGVNITEGAHNGIKKGESKVVGASKGMGSSIKPNNSGRGGVGGGCSLDNDRDGTLLLKASPYVSAIMASVEASAAAASAVSGAVAPWSVCYWHRCWWAGG